jgi:gas vesicle protein
MKLRGHNGRGERRVRTRLISTLLAAAALLMVPASAQALTVSGTAAPTDTTAGAHSDFNIKVNFGPGGEDLVPGVRDLRKRLGRFQEVTRGTFFDTPKIRSRMAQIAKVLSGAWGKVGSDVRSKIVEILAQWDDAFKKHAKTAAKTATGFHKANVNAIIAAAGIDLNSPAARRLRQSLAMLGPGGVVPTPSAQFAGAGAVHIHGNVTINGVTNVKDFEDKLHKRAKQRPHARRSTR